jgi:hypothetical protein
MPICKFYMLRGHEVVAVDDFVEAATFLNDINARTVAKTQMPIPHTDTMVEVSTVFLGIDHNYTDEGPPILFETMIFGGRLSDWQRRYATWEQAEQGHRAAVALVTRAVVADGQEALQQLDKKLEDMLGEIGFSRRTWHERVLDDSDD